MQIHDFIKKEWLLNSDVFYTLSSVTNTVVKSLKNRESAHEILLLIQYIFLKVYFSVNIFYKSAFSRIN